jgi:hypothetical protein
LERLAADVTDAVELQEPQRGHVDDDRGLRAGLVERGELARVERCHRTGLP